MKIKIISDGTVTGTRVLDADTGEELKDCTAVHWYIDTVHGIAIADVRFWKTEVDLVGEQEDEDFPPLEYQSDGGFKP